MATRNGFFSEAIFKFDHLERGVQEHLKRVYGTLAISMLSAAAGAYVHVYCDDCSDGDKSDIRFLLSALSWMCLAGFMNIFFRSQLIWNAECGPLPGLHQHLQTSHDHPGQQGGRKKEEERLEGDGGPGVCGLVGVQNCFGVFCQLYWHCKPCQ
ncbi:BI1-like protein [Mya arenaria]|uniref:BI1-like protein n=1 Tax=Mya arenaria TaxID=6604 RepID=A0ABY7EP63_MYAAR|nr:BI1-like protein [Mya arenaria]WAR10198.1 BI1-like protein [Mya arenaria]